MTSTLTRRGFVSMLASVPLVVVAGRRIFLPESERERHLRMYHEWVGQMQRDLHAALMAQHPIPYSQAVWKMHDACRDVMDLYVPPYEGQLHMTVEAVSVNGRPSPRVNIILPNTPINRRLLGDTFG